MEETIVTVPIVSSPFMEELHAAFNSISRLESLFLSPDAPDVSSLHHTVKRLLGTVLNYNGDQSMTEIDELLKNAPTPDVPTSLMSFYTSLDPQTTITPPSPPKIVHHTEIPQAKETVESLKYPQIHSVQFSYIDNMYNFYIIYTFCTVLLETFLTFSLYLLSL